MRNERALRARMLVTSKPRQKSERGGRCKVDSDAAGEFVFTIENVVKDVSLSQSGCEVHEYGLVMIDSGASVNVCPRCWENLCLRKQTDQFNSEVRTEEHSKNGKRQIWLRIGRHLRQHDFYVVEVTKPILSVSYFMNTESKHTSRDNPS